MTASELYTGIDLASDPRRTAACQLRADDQGLAVASLDLGWLDEDILELTHASELTGIDAPFGWPVGFTTGLMRYARHDADGWMPSWSAETLREVRLRHTDRHVARAVGKTPLSVSTDSIGVCALRAAGILLAHAETQKRPLDRVYGPLIEVYPAASLARWFSDWKTAAKGYKREPEIRRALLTRLQRETGVLVSPDHEADCVESDHCFDALIGALTTYARAAGATEMPAGPWPEAHEEGWIHLPVAGSLGAIHKRITNGCAALGSAAPARLSPDHVWRRHASLTLSDMRFDIAEEEFASMRVVAALRPYLTLSPSGGYLRGLRHHLAVTASERDRRFVAFGIEKGYAGGGHDALLLPLTTAARVDDALQAINRDVRERAEAGGFAPMNPYVPSPVDPVRIASLLDAGWGAIDGSWADIDSLAQRHTNDPTVVWAADADHVRLALLDE